MKRKMMSLVLSVVLILLSVLFLNNKKLVEATDDLVLLENLHPGYWNYLRPGMGSVVNVPPEGAKNLLVTDMTTRTQNGITLTVSGDRTMTLNGTNNGEGFNIYLGDVEIPNGKYVLSDGVDPSIGINFYVWSNNLKKTVADINNNTFTIDNSISKYHCGLFIASNAQLDSVTVQPMIRNFGDGSYSPYFSTEDCDKALVFEVEKTNIDNDDIKILENYLSQYSNYGWVSIRFPDGTGIQWKDSIRTDGKLDIWGRA